MNVRDWLRANGYDDNEWQAQGKKTRRNWWDVLAGGKNGKPSVRAGRTFPVLRAAQIRQGKPVTDNAICLNPEEDIPPIIVSGRWPKRED